MAFSMVYLSAVQRESRKIRVILRDSGEKRVIGQRNR